MHSELQPCGCFDFSFSFYCKLFCIYVGVYVIYCFFFFIDYCRVWSTFPCVTQWVLVACFINSCWSVSQLCLILCDPMDCSTQASLSFTVSRSLLKLMSTESVTPSNYLIFYCPLLLPSIFPSIRVFSNELALPIRWPKCCRKGDPFQGLKMGSCLTLRNEFSEETHDKARDFIGKGLPAESCRIREPRRTALPCGLQSRFLWWWD